MIVLIGILSFSYDVLIDVCINGLIDDLIDDLIDVSY